jgi:hypothetical protein
METNYQYCIESCQTITTHATITDGYILLMITITITITEGYICRYLTEFWNIYRHATITDE